MIYNDFRESKGFVGGVTPRLHLRPNLVTFCRIVLCMNTLEDREGISMRLIRTILVAGFGIVFCLSAADARDFFVQPLQAGPVKGTALAVITLQASTGGTAAAPVASSKRVKTVDTGAGNTAGKWVRPFSTQTAAATPQTAAKTSDVVAAAPVVGPVTTTAAAANATTLATPTSTPYKSMTALLSTGLVTGGDRIFLMDGYHGPISFRGMKFASPVTVAPMPGQVAHADSILVDQSSNIVFRDLLVWPYISVPNNGGIVRTYTSASDITFDRLDVRAETASPSYMTWTKAQWISKKRVAFLAEGARITITNTRVTGVQHGIMAMGKSALVEKNIVDGFSGDGMRALGDDSIVRNNKIQNCFQIDGNHADGFQSYSRGANGTPGAGTLRNLVVENNKIFEWTGAQTSPIRCHLQGISMFDGIYDNARIENNLVIVSAYHGITIAGPTNSVIRQNTVVNPNGLGGKYPWIRISSHKNGTPPSNVQVVNNLATSIANAGNPATKLYVANNIIAGAAASEFAAFSSQNLALKSGSRAVDAGDKTKTNATDILGAARWKGKGPDVGAFESF
jgi:Right handed beta helix region